MKADSVKKFSLVALQVVASLSLAVLFSASTIAFTVSAHTAKPQKPQSGCCAAVYVHVATSSNTAGNWTDLDNKASNNDPNAVVVVMPNKSGSGAGVVDNHPVGVWYDAIAAKWAIFNEDNAPMPLGAAFNVYALSGQIKGGSFEAAVIHVASSSNSKGNWTDIDNSITNGNPAAFLNVTPNWNPGGAGGVFDAHPLGVWYDTSANKWAIFNEGSMDSIPNGAAFNILIDTSAVSGIFAQHATASNTSGNSTDIDNAATNNNSSALVFATPVFSGPGGVYETHNPGVLYQRGKWAIFNEDNAAMLINTTFDVLASNPVSS